MLPGLEKIVVTEYQKAKLRENANELLIMQSLQVVEKRERGREKDSNYQKQCRVSQDNSQTSASRVFKRAISTSAENWWSVE